MGGNLGNRWLVVIASMCGLMVGTGAILIFATSVFLRPVSAELGITRGDLSGALLVATLFTAISCPIVGWLVDRYGARKLMLAGLPLYALCVAGFGFMQAQPFWVIPLLYGLLGFIGGLQTPIPYAYVVNRWFDRQRGLALGIATAGVGLGVALLPPYLAWMIGAFGWRQAYWGLAITVLVLAWLPVVLFVREPGLGEAEAQRGVAVAAPGTELPGDEASTAFKTRRFWALTIAFFLAVVAINGTLTHIIPLMMDRGIQLQQAAFIFSFAGYAIILGRIIAGWCLDPVRRRLLNPDGVEVPLTGGEYELLATLIERANRVLTRDMLLEVLRGRHAGPFDRAIDVAISRLRRKLEDNGRHAQLIKTVRGGGYVLAAEVKRQ